MKYYQNVSSTGTNYKIRLQMGPLVFSENKLPSLTDAAKRIDCLRAWVRAVIPDSVAEEFCDVLSVHSTPPSEMDKGYHQTMTAIPKQGPWQEKIKLAPEPFQKFLTDLMTLSTLQ